MHALDCFGRQYNVKSIENTLKSYHFKINVSCHKAYKSNVHWGHSVLKIEIQSGKKAESQNYELGKMKQQTEPQKNNKPTHRA